MTFKINVKGFPTGIAYWMPSVLANSVLYYPPDPILLRFTSWVAPVTAGTGIVINFRCSIYDSAQKIIDTNNVYNITVRDGVEYIYDWSANTFKLVSAVEPEFANLAVSYRRG